MPDGTVHKGVRVFITTHRILAYGERARSIIGEPVIDAELVEPGQVEPSHSSLTGALQLELPDGRAWVNRGRGCGCHSVLKALGSPIPWRRA